MSSNVCEQKVRTSLIA